ncbi:hypothetical protein [uncultured Chryseobacterium sp.]|uniref:hypothetical protein n=1 Tax=uncultured Chryseobacterium sp. TaxID=259322 RepID=UPI00374812BA
MIKNLKAWAVSVLLLGLSFAFSRQKSNEDRLKFKSERTSINSREKTTVFKGNVSLSSEAFSFENAKKVIVNETINEVKIYKPMNVKIIHVNGLTKTGGNAEQDVIVYHTKTKVFWM